MLNAVWQELDEKRLQEEDLRFGRCFAALINFLGRSFDSKFKLISAFDLFPEHKPTAEPEPAAPSYEEQISPGSQEAIIYFRAEQEKDRQEKLRAALLRVAEQNARKARSRDAAK